MPNQHGEFIWYELLTDDSDGKILQGPDEIPGGDYTVKGIDPQGALFALIGSKK